MTLSISRWALAAGLSAIATGARAQGPLPVVVEPATPRPTYVYLVAPCDAPGAVPVTSLDPRQTPATAEPICAVPVLNDARAAQRLAGYARSYAYPAPVYYGWPYYGSPPFYGSFGLTILGGHGGGHYGAGHYGGGHFGGAHFGGGHAGGGHFGGGHFGGGHGGHAGH